MDYQIVKYESGVVPGANADPYVLFNSLVYRGQNRPVRFTDFARYVLSIKNPAAGTLRAYARDNGSSWEQFWEVAVPAATMRNNLIGIPIEPHDDVRIDWVNGGVAQTGWSLTQALDDGLVDLRLFFADSSGNAAPTTIISGQLPTSLGQKTSAQSLSVVEASDSAVRKAASLRGCVRGEILAITVGLNSKTFNVPAAWKGYHVRIQADGCDLYYQISTTSTAAVADKNARAQEVNSPIDLTASASGNGCFKIPNGTSFDIPFPASSTTFALQASVDASVARAHLAES